MTGGGVTGDQLPALLDRWRAELAAWAIPDHIAAAVTDSPWVLAIQRGEVDGRCGWSWSTLSTRNRDLWLTKQIRVVLQLTDKKLQELAEVPSVLDVAVNPEQRAILKLIIARQTMARPYVAPPGVPADRLMALRNAFEATLKAPEFLADAQRQGMDVRPVTGAAADALIKQVYMTSPDVVKLAAEFMKEGQ